MGIILKTVNSTKHLSDNTNWWLYANKKESRLRLWNMVVQSTLYKKKFFQSKIIYIEKQF